MTTSTTTTAAPSISTTTSTIATTTTPFSQREIKVFGNLNYFMKDSIVMSPFAIDYILSFIGNFGNETDKYVVNSYFGGKFLIWFRLPSKSNSLSAPIISDTYYFYKDLKAMCFDENVRNFMLSDFVAGVSLFLESFPFWILTTSIFRIRMKAHL